MFQRHLSGTLVGSTEQGAPHSRTHGGTRRL